MPPCWHGWQYLGAEVRPSRAGALLVVQVHMVARSLHGGSSRGSLSTVHCAVTSEKGGGGALPAGVLVPSLHLVVRARGTPPLGGSLAPLLIIIMDLSAVPQKMRRVFMDNLPHLVPGLACCM